MAHLRTFVMCLLVVPGVAEACSSDDSKTDGGADVTIDSPAKDAANDVVNDVATDAADAGGLTKIGHFVVIYLENHSFDNLYGEFAQADGLGGLDASAPNVAQVDEAGTPYTTLPNVAPFPTTLPNAPFPIESYLASDAATADLHH